jgi:hypothetical protein
LLSVFVKLLMNFIHWNRLMTDFRALCARMADELDHYRQLLMDDRRETHALAAEARAALAQPEPQGPMPEVDDILRLAAIIRRVDGNHDKGAAALAEAILSHPDSRWQHAKPEPQADGEVAELVAWLRYNADYALQKAATATFKRFHLAADLLECLAQPEPQGPTDAELDEFAIYWWGSETDERSVSDVIECGSMAAFARAVLARWGRPAIEPVTVSERLPRPEDCDAEGRCWWFSPPACGPHTIRPCWTFDSETLEGDTHWLPRWALPVPGVEGEP